LDDDEIFTDGSGQGTNLYFVLVHEIGHVLGLGHSFVTGAIMNPVYKEYTGTLKLHDDDINGMRTLYGKFKGYNEIRQSFLN
jgi:matrix metalloproteinase-14 (membrane-inserted)